MVDAQFTEDEEVAKLRAWWKENGTSVIVGVSIGLAAVVGYNWWQSSTQRQAETASGLYEEMMIRQQAGDVDNAIAMGSTLVDDYSNQSYGQLAGLYMARLSVEKDDLDSAVEQLNWVIDKASTDGIKHTARLRLGAVYIHQNKLDEAKALLDVDNRTGFESQYDELLGDLMAASNDADAARAAYDASIEALPAGSSYREILTLKRNNLGQANN